MIVKPLLVRVVTTLNKFVSASPHRLGRSVFLPPPAAGKFRVFLTSGAERRAHRMEQSDSMPPYFSTLNSPPVTLIITPVSGV